MLHRAHHATTLNYSLYSVRPSSYTIKHCVEVLPLNYRSLTPDGLIVACLENRDDAAWVEFVRRFHALIAAVALRTARAWGEPSSALLDDLVQETYLKLCADECRLLKNFRAHHPGAIFGFLKIVTANVVHDHFKSSHATKRGGGNIDANIDEHEARSTPHIDRPGNGPSTIEQFVLLQQIDRCLARCVSPSELPRSRRIFWLYYRSGLSARAIASLPEINLTTKGVESTLFRLNRLVRKSFRDSQKQKSATLGNRSVLRSKGLHPADSL
jgi:RNA polymerase sigma-70 factor (ECF subfamily)